MKSFLNQIQITLVGLVFIVPNFAQAKTFKARDSWNTLEVRYRDSLQECIGTAETTATYAALYDCQLNYKGDRRLCVSSRPKVVLVDSFQDRFGARCTVEVSIDVPDPK